jgi:leucyl/phenylalanyl-tRNA--protein transferase
MLSSLKRKKPKKNQHIPLKSYNSESKKEGVSKVETPFFVAPTGKPVGSNFCKFLGTNGFICWSTIKKTIIKAEITFDTLSFLLLFLMPVQILDEEIRFPHPSMADRDGLLAIGGDLSSERLLFAYASGIYPWFDEDSPILWWSPDPRMILFPAEFKKSKSLAQTMRTGKFEVSFDRDFKSVIKNCAEIGRREEEGTWITTEMIEAYVNLHELGYAHSVETYVNGTLAGGLYGLSLGKAFFGESMFHLERDASKVALSALVDRCIERDFHFIDAQQRTEHLRSLGARPVPRETFLTMLAGALKFPTLSGKW